MFGVWWLILLWISSRAAAAAYLTGGTAPYTNTTSQASISPPYPLVSSKSSGLPTPLLVTSRSRQSSSAVFSSTLSLSPSSNSADYSRQPSLDSHADHLPSLLTSSLTGSNTTLFPIYETSFTNLLSLSTPAPTNPKATDEPAPISSSNGFSTPLSEDHYQFLSSGHGLDAASSTDHLPRPTEYRAPYPVNGSGLFSTTRAYGYPKPTESMFSSQSFNSTSRTMNSTNLDTACTVNVPSANMEWWYAATYYSAVGTFQRFVPNITGQHGPYLTMIPDIHNTPFDVASAITSDFAWTEHVTYDSEYDMTWTDYIPYTVIPSAATTSIVERDYLPTLPSGNSFPESDIMAYLQPSSTGASVPVATAANFTSAMTSATPFVYFSAYEVVYKTNGTTLTKSINLVRPTAIEYAIEGIEHSASASGTVPAGLMRDIPQSTCVPGTIEGSVTVLVVVDLTYIYLPHVNPFIIHIESTVLGWGDDSPIIVAQATSTGPDRLMTIDPEPEPTPGGGKSPESANGPRPQSVPASPPNPNPKTGGGALESPRPAKDAPDGSPSSPGSPGQGHSGDSQSGSEQSSSGSTGGSSSGIQPIPDANVSPRETVGSIGTNPVIVGPSSVVIVGSQTVRPGIPAVVIDGSSISVAPSATAIVVNGHTSTLPIVAIPGSSTQIIGTIGGNPLVVGPSSVVMIGSETLRPGGGAILVNGNPVSLVSSGNAVVVGSTISNGHIVGTKTSFLPSVIFPVESMRTQVGVPPIITIGSSTLTANAATEFFIAPGQTLTPGGTATLNGRFLSLDSSAAFVVVAGSTQLLPDAALSQPTSQPEIIFGGSTITALSNTNAPSFGQVGDGASGPTFVVSGQTLAPGHQITVGDEIISLAPSGSLVIVNGIMSTVANAGGSRDTPPSITIGSRIVNVIPGTGTTYAFGSQLLTPGGVITVDGTTISLAPSNDAVVINGITSTLEHAAAARIGPPPITIGGNVFSALAGPGVFYDINGQLLTAGGRITVDGTTISLAPGATALVVNGISTPLKLQAISAVITNPPILTIGTHTYTAAPGGGTSFVIDGQTLTLGGTIVVNGTTISLAPGATRLVYGSAGHSTTSALFPATTTGRARTTDAAAASASAGATGQNGEAAPTTSAQGVAHKVMALHSAWVLSLLGLLAHVLLL